MAGFNRFGGGGLGSLYTGIGGLGQGNANRRDDRFDERGRNGRGLSGFDTRRDVDRDFVRRDPSPRRRRYSPEPPYSSMRGRRDDRGELGSYSLDHMGGQDSFRSRGQRSSDSDYNRAGSNLGPTNRGDGILGAKPGDMPRDLSSNTSSGGNVNPQLAQQQQQLMAMVQTQSLLAAIQAQASAAVKQVGPGNHPPSLLQGMRMHDNRMDRQNRKRRLSPNRNLMRNRNQLGNRMQNRQQSFNNNNNNNRNFNQNRRRNRPPNRDRTDRFMENKRNESVRKSDEEGPYEEPYIEENPDEEEEDKPLDKEEETKETETPKPEEPKEKADEPPKEQVTEKEEPKPKTQLEESVPKSSINLAGQNVDKLTRSLFDTYRRKYVCKVCKIMCTKETCFRQHLFGRRHVKTWLESQGQSFEAVIFKKATEEAAKTIAASETSKPETSKPETSETPKQTAEEQTEKKEEQSTSTEQTEAPSDKEKDEEPEVKKEPTPPPNTEPKVEPKVEPEPPKEEKKVKVLDVKYTCDQRKMAVKNDEYITITSISEARVKINGFDTGLNTEGCEFVKAVSGFQCRLCRSFIHYGTDVMKHIKGRKHQANYRTYILEHPRYEQNQKKRNKELDDMLSEKEGETILLYEVSDEEEEVRRPSRFSRQDSSVFVKPSKYIAADYEQEHADDTMEDKSDADTSQQESEPQDDNNEHDNTIDSNDVPDEEGKEPEPAQEQDEDATLESEGNQEEDQKAVDELLMETEEEKINSEEIADVSIEADISLSDLASEVMADEEPIAKKTKTTAASKRGRKAARGGAHGGRGRGRGRGAKKNTRQSPRAATKPELSSDDHNEDVDFMDGFEVIDEVNDDET